MRLLSSTVGLVCIAFALACSSKSSVKGGSGGGGNAGAGGAAGGGGVGGSCTVKTPKPGTGKWPDSFRRYCSDGKSEINCDDAKDSAALQDGAVVINAPTYTAPASGVTKDTVTQLEWQIGFGDEARADAETYCQNLGSRLPSYLELSSLVDFGRNTPAIDDGTFNMPLGLDQKFWTASEAADGKDWMIEFTTGLPVFPVAANLKRRVRCVKGELKGEVIRSDCATVSDSRTGLMWVRSVPAEGLEWIAALEYCDGLEHAGFDDWRLPNLKEIQTIVKRDATPPLIDTTIFGDTPAVVHWTSTVSTNEFDKVGGINFDNGFVLSYARSETHRVRCVRNL